MISGMLRVRPDERILLEKIKSHPWVKQGSLATLSDEASRQAHPPPIQIEKLLMYTFHVGSDWSPTAADMSSKLCISCWCSILTFVLRGVFDAASRDLTLSGSESIVKFGLKTLARSLWVW